LHYRADDRIVYLSPTSDLWLAKRTAAQLKAKKKGVKCVEEGITDAMADLDDMEASRELTVNIIDSININC
jgi:hypothetical protein